MPRKEKRSILRSIGQFFGHMKKAVKSSPSPDSQKRTVRKSVEEEQHGEVTLRRTTIEEIEFRDKRAD